mmetsp:Transcript_20285/g.51366  ORF Transcript_20285/g.51366 Transcript_20285/m.51366 type:complete len:245 (+) Transcript_20285:575-1309(+)
MPTRTPGATAPTTPTAVRGPALHPRHGACRQHSVRRRTASSSGSGRRGRCGANARHLPLLDRLKHPACGADEGHALLARLCGQRVAQVVQRRLKVAHKRLPVVGVEARLLDQPPVQLAHVHVWRLLLQQLGAAERERHDLLLLVLERRHVDAVEEGGEEGVGQDLGVHRVHDLLHADLTRPLERLGARGGLTLHRLATLEGHPSVQLLRGSSRFIHDEDPPLLRGHRRCVSWRVRRYWSRGSYC